MEEQEGETAVPTPHVTVIREDESTKVATLQHQLESSLNDTSVKGYQELIPHQGLLSLHRELGEVQRKMLNNDMTSPEKFPMAWMMVMLLRLAQGYPFSNPGVHQSDQVQE